MSYSFNAGEVFKIAIQIEENGKKFYEESLKVVGDADIKRLFADLAEQEVEHKRRFESLLAQLPAGSKASTVWDPDNELDQYIKMMADQHVFIASTMTSLLAGVNNAVDALKMAIEFEKDSVLFFLTLEEAASGKKDQELINSLVKEEQGHLKRLSLELRKLVK